MQIQTSLLFLALLALAPSAPPAQNDLRARFEALDDKHDVAGMVQLWKDNPENALGVIDSYLEGSLAKLEKDPKVDPKLLLAMEARALRGAQAADQAFQTSIFADYAASFASWNAADQKNFREGQKLFREASKLLGGGSHEAGLEKARASLDRARPLGDWWGSAMALGAMASAELAAGKHEAALEFASQARLIDHDLRLVESEYDDLVTAATAAEGLERWERALVLAQTGKAIADQRKDNAGQTKLAEQIQRIEGKLAGK
ncbi:MAG TPA: hypothetical protein VK843_19440 [Planctomycetota bacterium]|nr:hypothetical protein [Planctomycetota bacterium]